MRIKRFTFVLIIVLSIAIGAGGILAFLGINPLYLLGSAGSRVISEEEYQDYQNYKTYYSKVEFFRKEITDKFYEEVNQTALEDGMLHGLFEGTGDVYSGYYTVSEYEELNVDMLGEYSGVGMTMQATEEGYIKIISVNKDSPAERAGILPGDYIMSVDGVDYDAETMDICAANVRGEKGTEVNIVLQRNGNRMEYTLVREKIITQSVASEMLDDNIAYIYLSGFEKNSAEEFQTALLDLMDQGAESLIIDLRDNPGGLVSVAKDICDMFMDRATIIYTQDQQGNREYFNTSIGKICTLPMVLLINENSASSSEIMAAAFQDNEICPIVGTKSFGKGIIQSVDEYKDGSAYKLTEWQYFSPAGNKIHGVGITPDYVVELPSDAETDLQLEKAIELLR